MPENMPLVYVVDDDEVFRNRLCRALRQRQWNAQPAANGEEVLALTRQQAPNLVLLDLRMPGIGGLELVEKLRALNAEMRIIMLTGYGSIPTTITALKRGADDYLSKPADADQIVAAYERLLAPEVEAVTPPAEAPSLARVEWEHMQRVIHDCGGNISQAARVLGIHRRSLQRKLSKYPPTR
jgi:two-component system response regulator RegA